jgi:hypothetical protein
MRIPVGYYYAQCVEVLRWLAHKLIRRPYRVRQARAVPHGSSWAGVPLPPGISEVAAGVRIPAAAPETWVAHPLDLDIGEVADGYHLIARSISLSAKHLLFEFAFVPEPTGEEEVWLNMSYDADIPPSWNYVAAGDDVQYERPALEARYAWFDFFRPDYEWMDHFDRSGTGGLMASRLLRPAPGRPAAGRFVTRRSCARCRATGWPP